MIYFDYAAATPVSDDIVKFMQQYHTVYFYNPSGLSLDSKKCASTLKDFRKRCAATINTAPNNVIFTAGATEANNLFLHGVAARNPGSHMLVSAVEHDAVLNVMDYLAKWFHISWETIPVTASGNLDLDRLKKLIKPNTSAISVIHTSNETGVIQPIAEIGNLIKDVNEEILFHSDASQTPKTQAIHFDRLGVDALTINGGKIYGPKMSGALVAGCLDRIDPLIIGGGQEKGFRSGTESLATIAGFTKALETAQQTAKDNHIAYRALQHKLETELQKIGGVINGAGGERSTAITSVTFTGNDAETLIYKLENLGIIVATGSACSAKDHSASHVLRAMGVSESDAHSTIRISFGESTTTEAIDVLIKKLQTLIK